MKVCGNNQRVKRKKILVIRIDKSLDKYDNSVLFPKKLAKANKMLREAGLPKIKEAKKG